MKRVNNACRRLLLPACLLIVSSCSKQVSLDWSQVPTFRSPHNLELSSSSFFFGDGLGGTKTLTIYANTSWEVTNLPDWLTADTLKGTGDASVSLTCKANLSFTNARYATFEVRSAEDDWDYAVPVTASQVKGVRIIVPDTSEVTFKYLEGRQVLPVTTNVEDWTITVSPAGWGMPTDWLSATKSDDNKTLQLSVDLNSGDQRLAYVVLRTTDTKATIAVTQKSLLEVTPTNVFITYKGGTSGIIDIDTDAPFELTNDADWLTVNTVDERRLTLTAPPNMNDERTAIISVSATGQHSVHITRELNVRQQDPFVGHAYVDLALPSGLLWATCNVGANSPKDYGDYYAWGETSTKEKFSWKTYDFNKSGDANVKFSKYYFDDKKYVLDPEDDVACMDWGGIWRMPTKEEWDELRDNCDFTWIVKGGHAGVNVSSSVNKKSIFLPAAGYCTDTLFFDVGSYGAYWSSTLSTSSKYEAKGFGFNSMYPYKWAGGGGNRYVGQSVRPVCP